MQIIITDLTRFKKNDIVCTAGIDPASGQCIRPMPYFSYADCKKANIHPGMVVEGAFASRKTDRPHVEDMECDFSKLKLLGPATSAKFEEVLKKTAVKSIHDGFDKLIPLGQKVIPARTPPARSIITIALKPSQIEVVNDAYDPEKIKLHIRDNDGTSYAYIGITDLGFHHYAVAQKKDLKRESQLNDFFKKQDRLYLRVGLSRQYAVGSRDGFWIQANGIYTFPDYLAKVRSYP